MVGITKYKDPTIVDNDDMYPLLGKWVIPRILPVRSCTEFKDRRDMPFWSEYRPIYIFPIKR